MKLDELSIAMVNKAVDAYLELAYDAAGSARNRPDRSLPPGAGREALLALFQRETVRTEGRAPLDRYTMRLGNRNYPFMKLQMQEHIVAGEFYFAVDSHDEMDIKPDFPDYDAWVALRKFNQELKKRIEQRFVELGLPTAATIRELCAQRRATAVRADSNGATILIVDDEEDLAAATAELLEGRGFQVHKASDGPAGIQAAHALVPDLLLLDYELPELDGLEVIAALRADPATSSIPIVLCTASKVSVGDMRKANGFLAKPFDEELLYETVYRALGAGHKESTR